MPVSGVIVFAVKTIFRLGSLGFSLMVACIGQAVESADESLVIITTGRLPDDTNKRTDAEGARRAPRTRMHEQLASLVRKDAGIYTAPSQSDLILEETATDAEETLELEPMTVKGERIEIPPALHEAPVQEFLRTGTIWEKVGPRFTRRFWMRGDRGVMFSISW